MADPEIGNDFLSNPTSQPLEYKETAPGQAIPPGLSIANVPQADDFNAIRNALNAIRSYVLTPLNELSVPYENLLSNTQWQLMTAVGFGPKMAADGVTEMPAISVSAYTTATSTPVCTASNTGSLKVNDLLLFDSSAAANMRVCPVRASLVTPNVNFTVGLPRGLLPGASAACTAQPIDAGGSGSESTTDGPDGWTKPSAVRIWREDNAVNTYPGSRYSLGWRKASAGREDLVFTVDPKDIGKWLGKTAVFGVGVKHKVKGGTGTWKATITIDGSDTQSLAADSTDYQWREVTANVPLTATSIQVAVTFEGNAGDVYYVTQPMGGVGNYLGAFNYSQPKGELLPAVRSVPLVPYQGASMTFPSITTGLSNDDTALGGGVGTDFAVRVRLNAETYGAVAATIRQARVRMRARSAVLTRNRINSFTAIRVQCTTGGNRGTAVFRISANGGTNYSSIQTSSAGVGTMQWSGPPYDADVNNEFVRYQVINVGNAGTYTANDLWDFTTAGVKTFSGVGYDGITVTPVVQPVTWGLRDRNAPPAPAESHYFEASLANALESETGWVQLENNGDMFLFTGTQAAALSDMYIDLNGYILA